MLGGWSAECSLSYLGILSAHISWVQGIFYSWWETAAFLLCELDLKGTIPVDAFFRGLVGRMQLRFCFSSVNYKENLYDWLSYRFPFCKYLMLVGINPTQSLYCC